MGVNTLYFGLNVNDDCWEYIFLTLKNLLQSTKKRALFTRDSCNGFWSMSWFSVRCPLETKKDPSVKNAGPQSLYLLWFVSKKECLIIATDDLDNKEGVQRMREQRGVGVGVGGGVWFSMSDHLPHHLCHFWPTYSLTVSLRVLL